MKATKKDDSYFSGICRIIEACGVNGVSEIHFGDVVIFRTEIGVPSQQSRKPVQNDENLDFRPIPQQKMTISDEKRALLDEQRRMLDDQLTNLDLEDPVLADKLSMESVEKEI